MVRVMLSRKYALAELLSESTTLTIAEWLEDIKANPHLYYADYVDMCRREGSTPISRREWLSQ